MDVSLAASGRVILAVVGGLHGPGAAAGHQRQRQPRAVRELPHLVGIAALAFELLASASTVPRRRWWT